MPREFAYDVLERVEEDEAFSDRAVDAELAERDLGDRDRRLGTELVYGVLRWRRVIDEQLDDVVHGGIDSLDAEVLRILRIGAYQLLFLDRVPDHAAVDEAVELTGRRADPAARSLVNAVLRELAGRSFDVASPDDDDGEPTAGSVGARYSLPNWIANRLLQIYGDERGEAVAAALAERPPTHIKWYGDGDPPASWKSLSALEGAYRAEGLTDEVVEAVESGRAAIQDLGSQLVAAYTGVERGDSVLDAAAGMGGKTAWLADAVGGRGTVVAVDRHAWKLERSEERLRRAGLADRCAFRAERIEQFVEGCDEWFDHVLVDAPCSGLGVLRRHPEIRWRRREADIPELVEAQRSMLGAAADLVAPGGTLTYAVCTFTTEEGPKQLEAFVEENAEFESIGPPTNEVDWAPRVDESGRLAVDPARDDSDCFFAGRLRRAE